MINGVLNVWKEAGFTSHDVVAKLRGILHQKKIGHTGTLDPDATGVLPVCIGKGTRLCDMLTDETKTYEALLHLGIATDTQDMSGTVTAEAPVTVTEEEVRDCIASFVGEQQQVPPMYSALKVNGKKLYELAREGIEIERKARTVHFYEISILEVKLPLVRMEVTCSKGTYIRTLCHDIGEKLGCHGCMEQLIRTRVGQFDRNGAHTLDEIAAIVGEGRLSEILVPVDEMFAALRSFATADDHAKKLAENVRKKLEVVTPDVDTPVRQLSGGNVQKVLVGREIAQSPKVLLVAFPTRGVDINTSHVIYRLLNEQKKKGVAVVCVIEDLDVVLELCDRIAVLCGGRISGVVDGRTATKERIGLLMTKHEKGGVVNE